MHPRAGVLTAVLCSWLLASASSSMGQQPGVVANTNAAVSKRPTLGLVLEDGGALGLAHIGVIRWLEEHRILVNYIAGTSMGGLVGRVYTTGRNAEKLYDVVKEIHWNQVMNGQTPFDVCNNDLRPVSLQGKPSSTSWCSLAVQTATRRNRVRKSCRSH